MTDQMKEALNNWWSKKITDEEFFSTMSLLILQQAEKDRQAFLKTAAIGFKLESIIQRIANEQQSNRGGHNPLSH